MLSAAFSGSLKREHPPGGQGLVPDAAGREPGHHCLGRGNADASLCPQPQRHGSDAGGTVFLRAHPGTDTTAPGPAAGDAGVEAEKAGLHIGFSCGVLNILSIHVLKDVMARHPDKSLEWVEDFNEKIVQLIAEDSLSCGFCIGPIRSDAFSKRKSIAPALKPSSMRVTLLRPAVHHY